MLVRKTFRYRVYPTPAQEARLSRWDDALRWLWNIANEQRLMALARARCDKRYLTAYQQQMELAALRAELPWLADVPQDVAAKVLVELDKAWQRCLKKQNRTPRFKKQGRDRMSFCEPHPKAWWLRGSTIRFPKLGPLRAVIHRPLEGKGKYCALKRDGDEWYAHISCEIDVPDPAPRAEPVVALDRGLNHLVVDSDGKFVANPCFYDRTLARIVRAERTADRRKKGSKNQKKAYCRVMRLHRTVRRQRANLTDQLSHDYCKSHAVVVIENLRTEAMIKVGGWLGRGIADAGWGGMARKLAYKLEWSGGRLVEVPREYSSQTCHACGVVDAASRSKERFCCTGCGHEDHADLNAAKVLLQRYNTPGSPWCQPTEASAVASRRSGKPKLKLRVPRRRAAESLMSSDV